MRNKELGVWDILTGRTEGSAGGQMRFVFALIMLASIVVSSYGLYRHFISSDDDVHTIVGFSNSNVIDADKRRLDTLTNNIINVVAARSRGKSMVESMSFTARYSFGAPAKQGPSELVLLPAPPLPAQDNVEMSPYILVRGILNFENAEKEVVAILDIEGEPNGKIYRVGSIYANGKGKILKIEKDKVIVRYRGRNFTF